MLTCDFTEKVGFKTSFFGNICNVVVIIIVYEGTFTNRGFGKVEAPK